MSCGALRLAWRAGLYQNLSALWCSLQTNCCFEPTCGVRAAPQGWVLSCCRGLTVGRFVVGLGIGISAVVVPAYLGELAPAKLRGRIVEVYEVVLCIGMLAAVLADAALAHAPNNWRWMVGLPVIPGLILSGKPRAPSSKALACECFGNESTFFWLGI